MKQYNEKDWQSMFGDAPAAFEDRVVRTVRRMENEKKRTLKPRWIPVLAVMLVLLAGVSLAIGGLGLLDNLGDGLRSFLQPGAKEMVQTAIQQEGGTMQLASFEAVEAVNDGRQVYLMLRIRANDPAAVLLIDSQNEPAQNMPGREESFSKVAYDSGRDLVQVSAWPQEEGLEVSAQTIQYDGEDILFSLSLMMNGTPVEEIQLDLITHNLYRDDLTREERITRDEMTLHIPLTDAREMYTADVPLPLTGSGLMLETLLVEKTPIATYLTVRYALTEDSTSLQALQLRDGIWFNWLDGEGNPYPDGQMSQSQNGSDGEVELTTAYRAFETIPTEITLEFYSGMSKERYDTVTIPIHPKGENDQ